MTKLSNDILREKTMKEFLTAMNIDLSGIEVSSIEGLFSFNFKKANQAKQFAEHINKLVQEDEENHDVKTLKLSELISDEIDQASCTDVANSAMHKAVCKGIFLTLTSLGITYSFSQDSGLVEITLPNPAYASTFHLLKYPHLTITNDGKLVLDLKNALKKTPEGVLLIEGLNSNHAPLVFLNTKAFESKKMFYASKSLANGSVEVTPYFFVPQSTKPPIYHFVLDISNSMENDLPKLKNSVNELAKQLFLFQPDAKVTLTTFSIGIHHLGEYTNDTLSKLHFDVNTIYTLGDTPLYDVTADFLKRITASNEHNNVLVFTDGRDKGSKPESETTITTLLAEIGTQPTNKNIRNKFYVFSYATTQSDLIQQVTSVFKSDVINIDNADFLQAQTDPELMKKWAAARELFVSRIVIEEKNGETTENTYSMPLDLSGQLAALKPKICQPGETINILISDGDGKTVVESTKKVPLPGISYANILSNLGLHANTEDQITVPELPSDLNLNK